MEDRAVKIINFNKPVSLELFADAGFIIYILYYQVDNSPDV